MAGSIGIKVKGNGNPDATTASGTSQATGSTFVAFCTHTNGSKPTSINDNKGNSNFTQVGVERNTGGGESSSMWVLENGAGGAGHTFTAHGSLFVTLFVIELIGAPTSSVTDTPTIGQIADTSGPAYTVTMGAANAQADEFIVVGMVSNRGSGTATFAESTGFTKQLEETDANSWFSGCLFTKIVSASSALTPSLTDSGTTAAGLTVAGFKIAAGGSTTTVTPAQATVTVSGKTPTTSAFQNVRIREVLVNESGQAVGGAANIHLAVWYGGVLNGAPDISLNGMTTDAAGTTSWSIATGSLAYNQPIFYVAQDSLSYSKYTCARMIPSYE